MYKVNYSFQKGNPSGGFPQWTTEFKLYDVSLSADGLQEKINEYLQNNHCGYHTNISVVSIDKI